MRVKKPMRRYLMALCMLGMTSPAAFAGVEEGIAAMERGDFSAAYREFLPLAERGDPKAMITIGLLYYEGTGVVQDYERAYDWYLRAFERNNGDAYNNIGVLFRDGLGVPKSSPVAYFYFVRLNSEVMREAQSRRKALKERALPVRRGSSTKGSRYGLDLWRLGEAHEYPLPCK